MVTKEEIKKEVDKLPNNILEEVYAYLKTVTDKKNTKPLTEKEIKDQWEKWWENLKNFSPDFMEEHDQPTEHEVRESFD